MLDFDAITIHRSSREVLKVLGDNHVTATGDRRRQNVAVIGVGKVEHRDECLISGNQAVTRCAIHEGARAFKGGTMQVGLVAQQCVDPLTMDIRRPFHPENVAAVPGIVRGRVK